MGGVRAADVVDRAVDACADLLARRGEWLAPMSELLLGQDGTAVVAPA